MLHAEAQLTHGPDDLGGRRGASGLDVDHVVKAAPRLARRIDQHAEHRRRHDHVGDPVLGDQPEDQRRIHATQADVHARHRRDRPREAPAVGVEHRQRPEEDGARRDVPRQNLADGHHPRAAVVIDDTLRVARGSRRVIERDRLPLVADRRSLEVGRALSEERLVLDLAQPLAGPLVERIVEINDEWPPVELSQGLADRRRELAVGDQDLGLAVAQDVGDGAGVQPGVDGVEHGAERRDPMVRLEYGRHVGQDHRHRVALADAPRRQCRGKPARPRVELAVADASRAVNDRGAVGINGRRAGQESQRRQR